MYLRQMSPLVTLCWNKNGTPISIAWLISRMVAWLRLILYNTCVLNNIGLKDSDRILSPTTEMVCVFKFKILHSATLQRSNKQQRNNNDVTYKSRWQVEPLLAWSWPKREEQHHRRLTSAIQIMMKKLHSALISGAFVTAVAADGRANNNSHHLRHLKVNFI